MEQIGIPGAAVAVIKNEEVVYKKYLGQASLEYDAAITNKSLFRLHSLSKIFVAVGVFQLIEEKKMALEDPISKYLTDLPLAWQAVKIKHLLSHSSGLPDMREETNPSEAIALKTVYEFFRWAT